MGLFDFLKGKKKETVENQKKPVSTAPTFHQLTIEEVIQETPDAVSVYLIIPRNLKSTFDFKVGQYITLRNTIDGATYLRSYSLSSCPVSDSYYRVAIKRKRGGAVSGYLVDNLKKEVQLEVFPPLGSFTPKLVAGEQKDYFLFAGGSGITPLWSIAKYLLSQNAAKKVVLVYANRNTEQTIYRKEIASLQKKYGQRLVVHMILDEIPEGSEGLKGIFKADDYANLLNKKYVESFESADYFICGPDAMMQEVEVALKEKLAIPAAQVNIEYFTMEKQPTDAAAKLATTQTPSEVSEPTDGATTATIILHQKTHQVTIAKEQTVLEATLDAGIDAPFMCEAGVCSTCRAKLTKGKVNMLACYALGDKEVAEGYILTCQAVPETAEIEVSFDA